MSKTFNITFNNFQNISVKIGASPTNQSTWVDVNLNEVLSVTCDHNDQYGGNRCLMFIGESVDFINTPSMSLSDSQGNTYTGNAKEGWSGEPFKFYLYFGVMYDDRAYITNNGVDIYIASALFVGDTNVNCGGVASGGGGEPFYTNDFGFMGIYKVDKQTILNIMSNDRYKLNELGDYGEIIDLFKNIKTVYKTPVNIEENNPLETIYIDGVGVNGQGQPIENYIIEFETESVKIQGYYNSVLDNDTEIQLNICYYGLYSLDSGYINHELKLKFICDLMTNNTLCNIYIDDIIIDTVELKIGYEIPLNDLNINETKERIYSIYNEGCYITLKEKRIANNHVNTIIESTTIETEINNNNLTGFIRCDNVIFYNNNLTDYEKTLIINNLKNGVYI